MAKADIETLVIYIGAILETKLNPAITAVNIDKADLVTLKSIDAEAFFYQTLNEKTANYDPFVFWGMYPYTIKQNGSSYVIVASFFVIIVLSTMNVDDLSTRQLRYSTALINTFKDSFQRYSLSITGSGPIGFQDINTAEYYNGVAIEFNLEYPISN